MTLPNKILTIIVVVIAGFMLLESLQVPIGAFLTFGVINGVVLAWTAQNIISNYFGGLMILITHPFKVGDKIKSPKNKFEGFVTTIGWYMTELTTLERTPLYIPNSLLLNSVIENQSLFDRRLITTTVGLRHQDIQQIKNIINDIEIMLSRHENVDQDHSPLVHFVNIGTSSLDIDISFYTTWEMRSQFRTIKLDVLLKVGEIIKNRKAKPALPINIIEG